MTAQDENNDDTGPANLLEHFSEVEEVINLIKNLTEIGDENFEKKYEKFKEIMSRYQEQPHLLDPHLPSLIEKLLIYIQNKESPTTLVHESFKFLYVLSKVRRYKIFVKFLPHEVDDFDFTLNLLKEQNIKDLQNWETRYILLLWMSILILNPFKISLLDASCETSTNIKGTRKMEAIFDICQNNINNNDTCSGIAAYFCGKYIIREDVKLKYMEKFFHNIMSIENSLITFGQLAAISCILKNGRRDDLLKYVDKLLTWILLCEYKSESTFLKYKFFIKIIQRIGLIYLKPRIASWRYKRGVRSLSLTLEENNEAVQNLPKLIKLHDELEDNDNDQEFIVSERVEEVIEELLQGLRSASCDVRWSSAKGIGRITNRLPKLFGDEVVGSVIEILNPLEPNEAWHGACLAIAELAKRGLLLPYRLETLVPILFQALFYDEIKGYMSVGQHIRDAACYMCWAFARAYDAEDLKPFVNKIAEGLLTVACFDREVNCRRAAAAAFQESVGRLGSFPYGIEILTVADFFSVGTRSHSFLNISCFIAQYEEYKIPLITHLLEKKINHWDINIRKLSAKALHKLTILAPKAVLHEALAKLLQAIKSSDITIRHGSVLAIGEMILAHKIQDKNQNDIDSQIFCNQIISDLNDMILNFFSKDLFRGVSGEIMKECCVSFILNCSKARLSVQENCLESWQKLLDLCLVNKNKEISECAAAALKEVCIAYYDNKEYEKKNSFIVYFYLKESEKDLEEEVRMGYVRAIGALPKFMVLPQLNEIIECLIKRSLPFISHSRELEAENAQLSENPITISWSESRRESVRALANVIETVGFDSPVSDPIIFNRIFQCYLEALGEYTIDVRGDIGAWVRESAMNSLYQLITTCPQELLNVDLVHSVVTGFAQQAVEKIDRTRALAGKLFYNIMFHEPKIPFIMHQDEIKNIFPQESLSILWLFADHTFPYFCSMLQFKEYSPKIILGLTASMGQLTESLVKYSSAAFFDFLRCHESEIPRICNEITKIFEENLQNERITYPLLNFLDLLFGSGIVEDVLKNDEFNFSDEIYRLIILENEGHKKLYKLASSVNVLSHLIQVQRLQKKVLSKMLIFLGLTHVHIRKTAATKLYEALTLYGDTINFDDTIQTSVLEILSETDWGLSLNEIRPKRNEICALLGVKPPINMSEASKKK